MAQAVASHEGFCVLNDKAPTVEDKSQFLCFINKKVQRVRCGLTGEGSNIRVGTWAAYGANEGINFSDQENDGNSGFVVCNIEAAGNNSK